MKSEDWYIKYKGLSLKLKRGEKGTKTFKVLSNKSLDIVRVSVDKVIGQVKVSIEPQEFKLKDEHVNVNVSVYVPEKVEFKPLWLVKLKFESSRKVEFAYLGILPVNEACDKVVIRYARSKSLEYAVGAIGFTRVKDYYISYRWRNGNAMRGEILEIAKSKDGLNYQTIKTFKKQDYNYKSFEASTLIHFNNTTTLLYCADVGGYWRIFKTTSEDPEKLSIPGKPIVDKGKDPTAVHEERTNTTVIVYSDGRNRGHDLTILRTKDLKSFETIVSSLIYSQFTEQGNQWARTHIHAGKIATLDGYFVLFYDALPRNPKSFGSGWLGVAISEDLKNWVDLTSDNPLWKGRGIDKTFRYVDLYYDEKRYIFYAEEEFDSGEKNLVAYYDSVLSK